MTNRRDEILRADRRFVWRPYTSHEDHQQKDPLVIERAQGVWLYDYDGRRYLDANSSWWVCNLGHAHPRLVRALQEQAAKLAHCSLAGVTHEEAAFLAEEIVAVAPRGLERVFFSDDGSTAVEVAIKIAHQFWAQNGAPNRTKFVSLNSAYHGDTLGAVSVGAIDLFKKKYAPLLFETFSIDSIEQAVDQIRSQKDSIAAVIIEPLVQGAAGMRMWPAREVKALADLVKGIDVLLIADEVFTGYGRTGAMWASEEAAISPDILCTAKGFSGGMLPMSATLTTRRVYDGFSGGIDRALMHGHSFCGNPLGAAIAREVLRVYRDDKILDNAQKVASRIARFFEEIGAGEGVKNSRSLGCIGALELGQQGYRGGTGWRVYEEARARGLYLRPLGDTVYIAPPLTISENELEFLLDGVRDSIDAVRRAVG